jgi:lantibiotic modifying enzyme
LIFESIGEGGRPKRATAAIHDGKTAPAGSPISEKLFMWQPITDPETGRRCWRVIEDIERRLVDHVSSRDASGARMVRSPGLASGEAGLALFFAYLGAVHQDSDVTDRALEALDRSVEMLGKSHLLPSLYSGFCGVGWLVEHLTRKIFDEGDDLSAEVDEALLRLLSSPGRRLPYDLVDGLSGFGAYLVERMPHSGAAELFSRVLDLLERTSEEADGGTTWHTGPGWLTPSQREHMPEGCYNLGVAHGVPGVIGVLAAAQREGVQDRRIPRLAENAIRWMLRQKLSQKESSVFPRCVIPGKKPEPARTAWCYGDLGIAAVLLSAARSFGRPDWEREALALAHLAASRPVEAVKATSDGLCHGTAGLAHLYNRIFQATGDIEMKEAALTWYRRALDMQCQEREPPRLEEEEGRERGEYGFLTGIAGTGLALLAAVTDIEPDWDRVMLVSVPPQIQSR